MEGLEKSFAFIGFIHKNLESIQQEFDDFTDFKMIVKKSLLNKFKNYQSRGFRF